jgi:hypothetical protein
VPRPAYLLGRLGLVGRLAAAAAVTAVLAPAALTAVGSAPAGAEGTPARVALPVPGIDPGFIYGQLAYMATHFQRREAGYVTGAAGHDGFARYWASEMVKLLGPLGATARRYQFRIRGWLGRPASAPAVNVEVTVPGSSGTAQAVVIGCHYDGEAISTQSAYDDASGCAIELGVAQAMARFWRGRGLYPARTLRFVLFDAEEQGLLGSFDYLNHEANGSAADIVAMFNEEQSGIGYPLRFLGKLGSPLMTTHVFVSPAAPDSIYPRLVLSAAQEAANRAFVSRLKAAVGGAFLAMRRRGYQELTYHGNGGSPVWRPIFTAGQAGHVPVSADTVGSSDQMPFTLAGIPDATFVGNFSYYGAGAAAASYPYDRPDDKLALMNTFADGGTGQSQALTMALGLPGMLTTWMLSQPGVLGQARPDGHPLAAIGSIGQIRPLRPVTLSATGFAPGVPAAKLSYSWRFGDGTTAAGRVVRHVYAAAGSHPLSLRVSAPGLGARTVSETLRIGQPVTYANPYTGSAGRALRVVLEGRPPENRSVILPVATPGLTDKVARAAGTRQAAASGSSSAGWMLTVVAAVAVATLAAAAVAGQRRSRRSRSVSRARSR